MGKRGVLFIELFSIFFNINIIFAACAVIFFSLRYFKLYYILFQTTTEQIFFIGVLVAILTTMGQWITGGFRGMNMSINKIKDGREKRKAVGRKRASS